VHSVTDIQDEEYPPARTRVYKIYHCSNCDSTIRVSKDGRVDAVDDDCAIQNVINIHSL